MKCEECKNLISSYIDGDCLQKQEFERHVAQCAVCREEFAETKKIVELCRHMPEIPLPEGFSQRLHERLEQEAKPGAPRMLQWHRHKRSFAVGAAAVAASLVFVATPFFRLYQDSERGMIPEMQNNQTAQMMQEPEKLPEASVAPQTAENNVQSSEQQPISPQTTNTPANMSENIAGQKMIPQGTGQLPEPTQPSAQAADRRNALVPAPQETTGAPASQGSGASVAETGEIATIDAHPNKIMAARGSLTPTIQQVTASADSRAWLQKNAAGYESRQTVDGLEIVALSETEYQALLESGIPCEMPQEVPQTAMELMRAYGYYAVLK